ncbi:hypothetical protein C8R43DRAFT_898159 [Mycena crocata]|nr:hypothetical protein C8R43DRAFT_898159 [Mycena crocata]
MPPRRGNRYLVLTTSDDPPPRDHDEDPVDDDDKLPPSDPPEPLSGSESGAESETPIVPPLPSLLPLLQEPDASSPIRAPLRRIIRRRSPQRSSSLPPADSAQIIPADTSRASDDVIYTPRTTRRVENQRVQLKRQTTLAAKRSQEVTARVEMQAATRLLRRNQCFDAHLQEMHEHQYSMAEFVDYVFDPATKLNTDWRWKGFFAHHSLVEKIFGHWTTSKYNATSRAFIDRWATKHVASQAYTEARAITSSGILSRAKKTVDEKFFLDFSLAGLTQIIRGLAPHAFAVFDAFSTTARQLAQASSKYMKKKELMKGAAALTLLRGASLKNDYAQSVTSTYLAATGGQRQHFSVLSLFGFTIGYTTVVQQASSGKKEDASKASKRVRVRVAGLFSCLRDACMNTVRALALSRANLLVYDNVNLMNRIAEQILGRKSAQENGTCATLIPLRKANLEHLLTSTLDESIAEARPLTIDDITFNPAEGQFFRDNMVHTVLRTIILHGGEGYAKWKDEVDALQPVSPDVIEVHKTPLHPLPTMEIDESTITGNVDVIEEIMRVLGFKQGDPEYTKYVQIIAGDQLTIARQRSILNVRLGHESGAHAWRHIVLMPGLFHAKIADCHGVLETHFGKANVRSPGSLGFHNTVLDRLPITLTSLPPFRTCRDLIMVSLYARVLHCLLLVSGKPTLEACAESIISFSTLVGYAEQIYKTYTDVDRVLQLRESRIPEERQRDADAKADKKSNATADTSKPNKANPLPHIRKGDMVFENALLFLRDALLTREFADAIKTGDSGRIVLILRVWAFSYRGNGRSKYAHEMLHLLHNLICVWTKELRFIVLQNWLANPQGKINGFVEIDLVQEHLNFWIKKIYKADGDGHSWEWLSLVSPCVDILRQLATKINVDLGARQGSKHATPELKEDIGALMKSLAEHEVYVEKEGRVLDDDEAPAPDALSVGMAALTHGSATTPLDEFNQQFEVMRARRGLTPVFDLLGFINPAGRSSPIADDTTPAVSAPPPDDEDDLWADLPDLEPPADDEDDDEDAPGEEYDEDLFADSPTLTRLDEGDIEFDMDDVPEWYLDEDDSSDDDDDLVDL